MEGNKPEKFRPDWHIDAKWVSALLLLPIFMITFLLFNFKIITNRDNGPKVAAKIITALYAPHSDPDRSIAAVREKIKESPDKSFKPFPTYDIKITEDDLSQDGQKVMERIFGQLAEKIYYSPDATSKNVGLLAIFTVSGNAQVSKYFTIALIITLILLTLVILFSADFGRLASAGWIFVITGLAPTLFLFAVRNASAQPAPVEGAQASIQQMVSGMAVSIMPTISPILLRNYLTLTLAGLVLLIIALVGRIVLRMISKKDKKRGDHE